MEPNGPRAECWVILGFGEASAGLLAAGFLTNTQFRVCLPTDRAPSELTVARLRKHKLQAVREPSCVRDATVVVSLVTPDAAFDAARSVAAHLTPGTFYVDMNSIASETASRVAEIVEAHGARFIDAAVMGPVPLQGLRVPILLSGAAAEEFVGLIARHGLNATVISTRAGDASALKMLWSVMTKGTIGLLAESLVAAHRLGLLDPMLGMLAAEYGATGTPAMIRRMLGSTTTSGDRRLGEMSQAARTVAAVDVPAWTVEATTRWIAALNGLPGAADASSVGDVVRIISDGLRVRAGAPTRSR